MTEVKGAPGPKDQGPQEHGALRGVLPAGTSLRGYELKSILGQGAFGITYRARDLTLGRDVAIKEYLPTSLALREGRTTVMPRSPDHAEQFAWGRERFLDEARTLARLDRTPAIVRVHDFLEDNGTAYMVMALIEGETLSKRLMREQRLTPEAIERLVFPLLDGLEEVHAIGFLHRDIKPANIMVDSHGRPTLIDFGASRAAMAERSTTLTAIFTPGYAAAEQFTSATLGPWSDIYGLAATLYHAITGEIPPSAIDRILNDSHKPLSELMPAGFAPELLAGIDAGLAVRVDDRPQSIAAWRQMLRGSMLEATRIARKPGQLTRAATRSRKAGITVRGPVLWASIAAAVVVLTGAGYLALTANTPTTINTAALSLSAEQLEQALAERRKADTLAAEKRRLEDEARVRAEADADAKRRADAELEQARQARQKAEQELAELKAAIESRRQANADQREQQAPAQRVAEEEAQRKAEAEAASLREAEEQATRKAAADAEAKRQADQALAVAEAQRKQAEADASAKAAAEATARSQASDDAQRKAEAEAAARRASDEAQAKAQAEREKAEAEARIKTEAAATAKLKEEAEMTERTLRLDRPDRERLQVALTSLGFDTRGNDGILGPRSREMIAAWQKARNQPETGFLTAFQQQTLTKEAAPALSKYDEQKKAEEDAKARPVAASPASSASASSSPDGLWRGTYECSGSGERPFSIPLETRLTDGSGVWIASGTSVANGASISIAITVNGANVDVMRRRVNSSINDTVPLSGTLDGNTIRASGRGCTMNLTRDTASIGAARNPASAFNGTYVGNPVSTFIGAASTITVRLTLRNGRGSGLLETRGCNPSPFTVSISARGEIAGQGDLNCIVGGQTGEGTGAVSGELTVSGKHNGKSIDLTFRTPRNSLQATLDPAGTAGISTAPARPAATSRLPDGTYTGALSFGGDVTRFSVPMTNDSGTGTATRAACGAFPISLKVLPSGDVTGEASLAVAASCNLTTTPIVGRVDGDRLVLSAVTSHGGGGVVRREFTLIEGVQMAKAAEPPATPSSDGLWRGTYACERGFTASIAGQEPFTLDVQIRIVGGSGAWRSNASQQNSRTFEIDVSVDRDLVTVRRAFAAQGSGPGARSTLTGRYDGNTISASGLEQQAQRSCSLALTRL